MSAEAASRPPRSPARRVARVIAALLALGLLALLTYGLIAQSPNTTIDDALAKGRRVSAPGFGLDVLARGRPGPLAGAWDRAARDGAVKLSELRGTPVVLNFWASWCVPCREEAPLLQRGWRSARPRGVLFVGLNMQDVRSDALGFLREFRQDYPHVRDPSNATARRWGVTGIPETFFIDRRGSVVGHVIGVVSPRQLRDGVQAALRDRPSAARQGGAQRPTR